MLHIVNKSPLSSSTLHSCLRFAQPGDALLLIEDGVYAAAKGASSEARMREACTNLRVFVLQPDTDARGITAAVMEGIALVDYAGFVDLAAQHNTSHAWL